MQKIQYLLQKPEKYEKLIEEKTSLKNLKSIENVKKSLLHDIRENQINIEFLKDLTNKLEVQNLEFENYLKQIAYMEKIEELKN
jgi:hypothetical protein